MPAESDHATLSCQRWPCGPDCQHAQTLAGSYGEWHWCNHPVSGGRIMRDGRECRHYTAASSIDKRRSFLPWRR